MERPLLLPSAGHVGHFMTPSKDSIYYQGELFSTKAALHPGVIKFQGFYVPPFIQVMQDGNKSFTAFGAWFSLIYETAKRLNYSLVGNYFESSDPSDLWPEIFGFRPDILIVPFMPNNNAMIEGLEMEITTISKAVDMVEMDHCLSQKKFFRPDLLAMLHPFGFTSLILLFTCLFIFSSYAFRLTVKQRQFRFQSSIWYVLTSLISPPHVCTSLSRWRLIGLTWLIGINFLQRLFSGDMFTAMAAPPELDVINSWIDLATKSNKTIFVLDGIDQSPELYLTAEVPMRRELTKRIKQIPYEFGYSLDVIEEVMKNVSSGEAYFLGMKHMLEQYSNQFFEERYSSHVHISNEYSQDLPLFIPVNYNVEPLIQKAFNLIITRTHETGLYKKWVESYSPKPRLNPSIFAEYNAGCFQTFTGLLVICGGLCCLALCFFLVEICLWKRKKLTAVKPHSKEIEQWAIARCRLLIAEMNAVCNSINNKV